MNAGTWGHCAVCRRPLTMAEASEDPYSDDILCADDAERRAIARRNSDIMTRPPGAHRRTYHASRKR